MKNHLVSTANVFIAAHDATYTAPGWLTVYYNRPGTIGKTQKKWSTLIKDGDLGALVSNIPNVPNDQITACYAGLTIENDRYPRPLDDNLRYIKETDAEPFGGDFRDYMHGHPNLGTRTVQTYVGSLFATVLPLVKKKLARVEGGDALDLNTHQGLLDAILKTEAKVKSAISVSQGTGLNYYKKFLRQEIDKAEGKPAQPTMDSFFGKKSG